MLIKFVKWLFYMILIFATFMMSGCSKPVSESDELVVYSARKEQYVKPIIDKFEKETGIKVRLLAGDETLVNKILVEKERVHADIFFSTDVGALEYLRIKDTLQPYDATAAKQIIDRYKIADNSWFPLGARCRVLMYNKDLISEKEMPKTFWEVADPKWEGQFMITRGGNGSMVAQITALRTIWGDEKTAKWLKDIGRNAGAITKDHAAIRTSIGAGEYKFGIVNDNYFYQQLIEDKNNNVGIIYPDQGLDEMGVFVNVSGVGIVKGAPNMANAKNFIDFVLKPEQLKLYAEISAELPVNLAVDPPEFNGLLKLGEFKEMKTPYDKIGYAWYDVKKIIEESGLDINVK